MSAEQTQPPAEPKPEGKKPPTIEELIANQQKQIDLLAQGIVALNKKLEEKGGGGTDVVGLIKALTGAGGGGDSIEGLAKTAENLSRAADALDRFRNPPRLGPAEAMWMRLGFRSALPRYMTRAELVRMERATGVAEAFEEEAEGGHVE